MDRVIESGAELQETISAAGAPYDQRLQTASVNLRQVLDEMKDESDPDRVQLLDSLTDQALQEFDAVRSERGRARAAAALTPLYDVRDFGRTEQDFDPRGHPAVAEVVNSGGVLGFFPSDWLEAARERGTILGQVSFDFMGSGFLAAEEANDGQERLVLGDHRADPIERVAVHEMCHRMEYAVPELRQLEHAFHQRRAAAAWDPQSGEPVDLPDLGNPDTTRPPFFFEHYCETRYPRGRAFEILATGVEHMFFGPRGDPVNVDLLTGSSHFNGRDTSADVGLERFLLGLLVSVRAR